MSGRYASFMVDPWTSFGDYHMQKTGPSPSQNRSTHSISIATTYSSSTYSLPLSPPSLSQTPSLESLRSLTSPITPVTPARDVTTSCLREETKPTEFGGFIDRKQEQYTSGTSSSSLMLILPGDLDRGLRFSFETRVSKEYEGKPSSPPSSSVPQSPPQLLQRYSERDRHARPPVASPPRLKTSFSQSNLHESQNTPPLVTSFTEFRQALAERHEARRQEAVTKGTPALSFLSQDPFQCPISKRRSRSVGRSGRSEDESSRPASRKSSAPSATSARSSKSLKRGISKVRKLLAGSRKEGEKEIALPT